MRSGVPRAFDRKNLIALDLQDTGTIDAYYQKYASDSIEIAAGIGRRVSENANDSIRRGILHARKHLTRPPRFCLAFPKWSNMSSFEVVGNLNTALGPDCPVFGGVTGREFSVEETPLQIFGDSAKNRLKRQRFHPEPRYRHSVIHNPLKTTSAWKHWRGRTDSFGENSGVRKSSGSCWKNTKTGPPLC